MVLALVCLVQLTRLLMLLARSFVSKTLLAVSAAVTVCALQSAAFLERFLGMKRSVRFGSTHLNGVGISHPKIGSFAYRRTFGKSWLHCGQCVSACRCASVQCLCRMWYLKRRGCELTQLSCLRGAPIDLRRLCGNHILYIRAGPHQCARRSSVR